MKMKKTFVDTRGGKGRDIWEECDVRATFVNPRVETLLFKGAAQELELPAPSVRMRHAL